MKKQLRITGFGLLLFACTAIHAAAQNAEGFKLKNRSTFSSAGREHDPFWPIGWVKPAVSATSTGSGVAKEVEFSTNGFVLTSILLGQPAIAVINGREYAEGETIKWAAGGENAGIQLVAVQDGSVVLRHQDKNYTVVMHRKGEEQKQIAKTEEPQFREVLR